MSILASLCAFALGFCAGGAGGIVLGFVWYERKCGLISDRSGKRAAAIRSELDDVVARNTLQEANLRLTHARERSLRRTLATLPQDTNLRSPRG
jgi:hypothetical protein